MKRGYTWSEQWAYRDGQADMFAHLMADSRISAHTKAEITCSWLRFETRLVPTNPATGAWR